MTQKPKNLEAVYPLTPIQQGMFFHVLADPEGRPYFFQTLCVLEGELDRSAFRAAWDAVVQRHGVLRTAFAWRNLQRPLQAVLKQTAMPWSELDWRELGEAAQEQALADAMAKDCGRDLPWEKGPLHRLSLFRTGAQRHVFLWSFSHLIIDGWSLAIVFKEVMLAYEALAAGRPITLPPAPSFRTYVGWLESQDGGAAYWRERLAGLESPCLLAAAMPTSTEQGSAISERVLPPEQVARLGELARAARVTLNTVIHAAWSLCLARITGRRDVVFGSVISGRGVAVPGIGQMVGLLINTLPVRVKLGAVAQDAWLRRLQDELSAGEAQGHVALSEIQGTSALGREASLFDTVLAFENYPFDPKVGTSGPVRARQIGARKHTHYPMTLDVNPREGLTLSIAHDTAVFSESDAERLLALLTTALEQMVATPEGDVRHFDLVAEAERDRLLQQWCHGPALSSPALLPALLADRVQQVPQAPAVVAGEQTWTFAELDRRAEQLACVLAERGVGPESVVGVCLPRDRDLLVALLAVVKAGGAYLPLDPDLPTERLAFMLRDSGAAWVIADEASADNLPAQELFGIQLIEPDEHPVSEERVQPALASGHAVYLIYTSGSTGRPKGVSISHGALANYLTWSRDTYLSTRGGAPLHGPIGFDATVTSLWLPLIAGRPVVITDDHEALAAAFSAEHAFIKCTPAHLDLLRTSLTDGVSVATVVLGGESLHGAQLAPWKTLAPNTHFYNEYGPTEATVGCSVHVATAEDLKRPTIPIGKPIANTSLYVLDRSLLPVPIGVAGQLVIAGAGLARGYAGRPALTAERFTPHPFAKETGARIYHSGDQARYLSDGTLECLGRVDRQIKLRGYRIELGEIEAALLQHGGVAEAAVTLFEPEAGDRRLAAYVVPHNPDTFDVADLERHLHDALPEFMRPAHFVILESMPLSHNGKLDRAALPDPQASHTGRRSLPRNPLEEMLCDLFAAVLKVARVGVLDDFFALGGHSLLATQLASRAGALLGREVRLQAVFDHPTVASLAEHLVRSSADEALPEFEVAPREPAPPLSFSQQRLWILDQLERNQIAYNIPALLHVRGILHLDVLERALAALVFRHEILRTTFAIREGEPVQVIGEPTPLPCPVSDLSAHAAPEAEARRLAREEIHRRFDLSTGPLLRLRAFRTAADSWLVCLTTHHIISDGWTTAILVREIAELYSEAQRRPEADAADLVATLPELPLQYADYAVWQRRFLAGPVFDRQLAFWREQLADAPELLELPLDRPRPKQQSGAGLAYRFELDAVLTARLREASSKQGATLFMTLLSTYYVLLARYSNQRDIVVGTPIAGRNHAATESMPGVFINTLAIRAVLIENTSFRELLTRVRETLLAAYDHQDLPFERLVEELQPDRDLGRTPFFQTMLALQNTPEERYRLPGASVEPEFIATDTAMFDVTFILTEVEDRIEGTVKYSADLFEEATIARMVAHFQVLLDRLSEAPKLAVLDVPLLTPEERRLVRNEWNRTAHEVQPTHLFPTLFEEHVARAGNRLAASFGEERVTYAELDRRANRLAHALRAQGIGAESIVALYGHRSIGFLVAMLGVFKAGAAYLPLNIQNPAPHTAHVLELSGTPLLLTCAVLAQEAEEAVALLDAPAKPRIFCWDRWPEQALPETRPELVIDPDQLAYVIFTSGSTGLPKGVMIRHLGMLNHLYAKITDLGMTGADAVAQNAPQSFDISVWQFLSPLMLGGRVHVFDDEEARDPLLLLGECARQKLTILEMVPSLLGALLEHLAAGDLPATDSLRLLMLTGEALPPELARRWLTFYPDIPIVNAYGPTECSDDVTHETITRADDMEGVTQTPIGSALINTTLHVLDAGLQHVPIGVHGELYVGGLGVGRGYLQRPARTAASFVPDPFSREQGARLYRTGDVTARMADGRIVYFGRRDNQVKLRGFRIELGEIDALLRAQDAVAESAVIISDEQEPRILAYVTPNRAEEDGDLVRDQDQAHQWGAIFDDAYGQNAWHDGDPGASARVWIDSYSEQPFSTEAVLESVEDTTARILEQTPGHLLEIGCGTGLIFFRIGRHCKTYLGTDLSQQGLDRLTGHLAQHPHKFPESRFERRAADDFTGLPEAHFDTVVINEVVQYFPSVDYLLRVIEGALRITAPGGRIFLGGLRNYDLFEAFHATVQLAHAHGEGTVAELRARIAEARRSEKELLVAPGLFRRLYATHPRIGYITARLKGGVHHNEFTRYRYDLEIHVERAEPETVAKDVPWQGLDQLQSHFQQGEAFRLRDIPNGFLAGDAAVLATLDRLDGETSVAELPPDQPAEPTPARVVELARTHRYRASLFYCERDSFRLDALLVPEAIATDHALVLSPAPAAAAHRFANAPLSRELVPQLLQVCREKLPEYMVPSAIVELDALPLTANGKLDRGRLPLPEAEAAVNPDYLAPRSPIERILCEMWADELKREKVGIRDDFFELGGHSLIATRVNARLRQTLQVELPLSELFRLATVEQLAQAVEQKRGSARASIEPITPVPRGSGLPLSFAQQRLWFLHQLEPDSSVYNVTRPMIAEGWLDAALLERAYRALLQRHEALRTHFAEVDGQPLQHIGDGSGFALRLVDLSGLPAAERETQADLLANAEAHRPFDLTRGPLLRVLALRLGPTLHQLVISIHHIVSDGWSREILAMDTGAFYVAMRDEVPPNLPELPVQFADYAAWQHRNRALFDEQLSYWSERLTGLENLELPTDFPRPAVFRFAGATHDFYLPLDLADRLGRLATRHGVTPYMVMMAAFNLLLHRITGQDDIAVGTPVANRAQKELESLIGFFVNTAVIRTDLSRRPTVAELLGRMRERTLEAYDHQDLPFDSIVEHLRPERDLSRNPLFQVMFLFEDEPEQSRVQTIPGLHFRFRTTTGVSAKFDMTWAAIRTRKGLHVSIDYSTDLFRSDTVVRFGRYFATLLEQMAEFPECRVDELALLDDADRAQLTAWNRTEQAFEDTTLDRLFAEQVARTPHAPAITFEGVTLDYAALDVRANQIANQLLASGARGGYVAVCLERSLDLIAALLAVHKAGAAYLPLDPSLPPARLAEMIVDSGCHHLISWQSLMARMPADASLDRLNRLLLDTPLQGSTTQPDVNVDPGEPAYLIYTSGSTGKPKGVINAHRGIVNRLLWERGSFEYKPGEVFLQKTPFSFDVSVWEIFMPLIAGHQLVIAKPGGHRDPTYLAELMAETAVSVVHFVPSMLGAFLDVADPAALPALKLIRCSGEALSGDLRDRCLTRFPVALHNLYGPTEAAVEVTHTRLDATGPVSIGKPIANTICRVVDRFGQPVPIGSPGELVLCGKGLATGYLGRPSLTATAFVPDDAAGAGVRRYHTGDRVRYDHQGNLLFLGRLDQQLKLRGFRIEPGEIEARLRGLEDVVDAAVVLRTQRLVGYVAGADTLDGELLRQALRTSLPDYMVPATIVVLDQLPQTPSGKLDRKALPQPERDATQAYVPPQTDTERFLATIWQDLLDIDQISTTANFFDLGGHSLLITRMVSRIAEGLGIGVDIQFLFERPTIQTAATALDLLATNNQSQETEDLIEIDF